MKNWWDFDSYADYRAYKDAPKKIEKERRPYIKDGRKSFCGFEGCVKEIPKYARFCGEHIPSRRGSVGVEEKPLDVHGLYNIAVKYGIYIQVNTKF